LYTENLKLLNFSSVNDPGNFRYIRIISGNGTTYHTTSNRFDLSELPPGKNKLNVCYVFEDGTTGPATQLEITLVPPFYRTSWFYLLAGVSGTGLTLFGYRRRKRIVGQKQHERRQVEYKINLLKQQALVSNLNPHFIFNALNAIQHFVNSSNLKNANEYLALFSKLMRQHLNSAGRDLITVEEETDRLRNYLEIEKLRFGDKLDYEINLSERIRKLNVSIPNMIIQPFMENAIWHGFKGMATRGSIRLSMNFDDADNLIIIVADNGHGIGKVVPGMSMSKDPRGISLIRERLELLAGPGHEVLTFSELHPGTAFPGTVVTISLLPRMYRIAN
jgi:two-component sensor histidine kinase